VADGEVRLSFIGKMVEEEWPRTAVTRSDVELDSFVIMPNHLHGVVLLSCATVSSKSTATPAVSLSRASGSLGSLIAGFKQAATLRVRGLQNEVGARLWQRNYFEHVIRNAAELSQVRTYIAENPRRWCNSRY
jgi:REP-associated tyrosine transposase